MQLRVVETPEDVANVAADMVAEVLERKPNATVIPATGNSPMGLYAEMAERRQQGRIGTEEMRVFQLDGYLGIPDDDPRSLYGWMTNSFLDPLGIDRDRVYWLEADPNDPEPACRAYDEAIRAAGGIDLSILGLGPNGHLGFNEPPSGPDAPTRSLDLTPESVRSNAVYWGSEEAVPRHAITAGMTVLLAARRTILVVLGAHKREILDKTLNGPLTPDVPASYLRDAPDVWVIADRAATGER